MSDNSKGLNYSRGQGIEEEAVGRRCEEEEQIGLGKILFPQIKSASEVSVKNEL